MLKLHVKVNNGKLVLRQVYLLNIRPGRITRSEDATCFFVTGGWVGEY
jgi:hypothetical protein